MLKHILTTQQFSDRKTVEGIFQQAKKFQEQKKLDPKDAAIDQTRDILRNQIYASVFYEPSTRTRFSFEIAANKMGAFGPSSENAAQFSSAIKGETLEDSIRVISNMVNMIFLRHPEIGAAERAAKVSAVPILNCGDGAGEHPTQAMLDLYTIQNELGTIDDLRVTLVGDLLKGRTTHSLVQLLTNTKNPHINLVSPPQLKLPKKYLHILQEKNISFLETANLDEVIPSSDVVYMTRIQEERFKTEEEKAIFKEIQANLPNFTMDENSLELLPRASTIMHPLPRGAEIPPTIDQDKRAAYFRQAENGLYVRMSLLNMLEAERSQK